MRKRPGERGIEARDDVSEAEKFKPHPQFHVPPALQLERPPTFCPVLWPALAC